MDTFGSQMAAYRRRCIDPSTGRKLTQQKFANNLFEYDERFLYSKPQISQWENDNRVISHHQRDLLLAIVYVLVSCRGLSKRSDTDRFLESGGYAALNDDEVRQLPVHDLFEDTTNESDLLTISGILDTLKQLTEDKDSLTRTLNEIEEKRTAAISGISQTQRQVLEVIPYVETPLDDIFAAIYENIESLNGIRIKELNMRLHELRYLGLINRKKHKDFRWVYWREEPKSYLI